MNRSGLAAAVFAVAAQWACAAAGIVVHSATTNGVEVRWFEEMVPMKDGTRLYTYGALPPEGETRGIVFARNPYKAEKPVDMPAHAYSQLGALARGYAYVYQHVRGTGMSEGAWTPYEDEREDGLAALESLRRLPHHGGELFLLGGIDKARVLNILRPHIFFDDQVGHFAHLDPNIPAVHIPFGVCNPEKP